MKAYEEVNSNKFEKLLNVNCSLKGSRGSEHAPNRRMKLIERMQSDTLVYLVIEVSQVVCQ